MTMRKGDHLITICRKEMNKGSHLMIITRKDISMSKEVVISRQKIMKPGDHNTIMSIEGLNSH